MNILSTKLQYSTGIRCKLISDAILVNPAMTLALGPRCRDYLTPELQAIQFKGYCSVEPTLLVLLYYLQFTEVITGLILSVELATTVLLPIPFGDGLTFDWSNETVTGLRVFNYIIP